MSETSFPDVKGVVRDIQIRLGSAKRIDDADHTAVTDVKFSFLKPDEALFKEVLSNPNLCAWLTYLVLKPQLDKEGIGQDDFAELLDGPSIQKMQDAFWIAMSDFFHGQKTALLNLKKVQQAGTNRLMTGVQKLDPQILAKMEAEVDQMLTKLSEELSESSGTESTNPPGDLDSLTRTLNKKPSDPS